MGSIFGSYSIPMAGIYTSQTSLTVISNNIANVDTQGYVRQQTMIKEQSPINTSRYQLGTGSSVQEIRQVRNIFLDRSYRDENSVLGYWEAKTDLTKEIENILGGLSSYSIESSIEQFFYAWDELTNNPESLTKRAMVVESGVAFVETVNSINEQLDRLQKDLIAQISATVNDINDISEEITKLNIKIMMSEVTGDTANDYRDQRNLLIDQLSYLVDIDATEQSNGMVNITVGGTYLVNGDSTHQMEIDYSEAVDNIISVKWENTNNEVKLNSGKLLGLMDSGAQSTSIISEIKEKINILVNILATGINAIHSTGKGLDGSTGINFFIPIYDSLPIGIGNIQVNPEFDDLNKIAASSNGSVGDNTIAHEIVALRNEKCFNYEGLLMNVDNYYISITSWIGIIGQESIRHTDNQNTLINSIQNQKNSISNVSMDEELANMIMYQQAYNANVKVINAIDEMIDTIINMI